MVKKANMFHIFSGKRKHVLGVVLLFTQLFFANMSTYAQSDGAKATYDEETGTLTIANQGDMILLVLSENMPSAMRNAIQAEEEYIISQGKSDSFEVSQDEMDGYKKVCYKSRDSNGDFTIPGSVLIQINKAKDPLSDSQESAQDNNRRLYLPYVIAGIVLLMAIMAKLFYSRKKRKKQDEERKASLRVMQVIEEEKNSCSIGLNHVYQDPDNFFALDMHLFFQDTAVEKVYLSRDLIQRVNSYFKNYLDNSDRTPETGCYLIGAWERIAGVEGRYNVSIEDMVTPGDDMIPGEFSLNFGLKIGVNLGSTIRNLCEKTQRDYVQTAWMHSHPGLGLFLSSHDLTVQQQLTYPDEPKRLLAIVIDTNTPDWQTVFFSAKNDGTMNNKEDLLQVISFDTLLEWSRHKTFSASSLERTVENTFNITSADAANLFAFTYKAVNQMDDLLYASNPDSVYGFHAEIQQLGDRKIRLVSECETTDPNWNNCFMIKVSDASAMSGKPHCAELLNAYDFGIVYGGEQQNYIVYRNARQEICTLPIPLKEMKEWTRRKRV